MISIENLRYRNLAIDALTIRPGITTIIGPNGSGKTTFLKICAGIILPDSGTILIDEAPPRQTNVGWVNEYPDRNLLFVNVSDEIASPLRFRHDSCDSVDSAMKSSAETMGITHLLTRAVRELSGGEKILVSLAAALVHHPPGTWYSMNMIHTLTHALRKRMSRLSGHQVQNTSSVARNRWKRQLIVIDFSFLITDGSGMMAHLITSFLFSKVRLFIHCYGGADNENHITPGTCNSRSLVPVSIRNI